MKELPEPWEEAYGEAIPSTPPNPDTRFFRFRVNHTAITTRLRAINNPTMPIAAAPPVDIPPPLFVSFTFAPSLGPDVVVFAVGSAEDTDGAGEVLVVPLTVELLGAAAGGTGLSEEDEGVGGGEVETVGEGELLGG